MKITFLGTRGEISLHSHQHRYHSALLVCHSGHSVMVDCGSDWRHRVMALAPLAIVLTHAHPDHAGGLRSGAPCPVYATAATWQRLRSYPLGDRREVLVGEPLSIAGLTFVAVAVQHSIRAPAVGYRISAGERCVFYVPDVAALPDLATTLAGAGIYVGDGATLRRPLIRRKDGIVTGHAPIAAQLDWCQQAGVRRAIFTHCGSQIVRADPAEIAAIVQRMGQQRNVAAQVAYDGLAL